MVFNSEKIGELGLLYNGDCLEVLKQLPDNSVTAIVTDPPYALTTNKCIEGLHSIFNRCFDIGFPNLNDRDSLCSKYNEFVFVSCNTSNLNGAKIFSVIKPWISMPKSAINFDNDFDIRKEEINASDVPSGFFVSDTILMNKFDVLGNKFIGDYVLDFGDSTDFSLSQILSGDLTEFFNGGFRMPVSAIFSSRSPSLEADFPSPFSREGIFDFVWLRNDSGSNAFPPGFILTSCRTEDSLMLTFNRRGTSREQFATISTFKRNLGRPFIGPKIVRTSATISSLSSIFKPTRVSLILNTTDRTNSNYTFHLWLPPDFLDSIAQFGRKSSGFMGKGWDSTLPPLDVWREALRVAKPGAFLLVFGGTRTFHRLACGVEDAGWMLRDTLMWTYGSGFPKSTNISKKIDEKLGAAREVAGKRKHPTLKDTNKLEEAANAAHGENNWSREWDLTAPASEEARLFDGYGTSLKPSYEPVLVFMKPIDGTFADNALKHGIAGLNIDECRIMPTGERLGGGGEKRCTFEKSEGWSRPWMSDPEHAKAHAVKIQKNVEAATAKGRWPANLLLQHHPECCLIGEKKVKGSGTSKIFHDGYESNSNTKFISGVSHPGNQHADENGKETVEEWDCHPDCPIALLNAQAGIKTSGTNAVRTKEGFFLEHGGMGKAGDPQMSYGDTGYVSRYFKNFPPDTSRLFYYPKASRAERNHGCTQLPEKTFGMSNGAQIHGEGYDKGQGIGLNKVTKQHNDHPTVKSLELMKYLCTLIKSPTTNLILDPFAGSGTTGVACEQLNLPYILIEKETEYCDIIKARTKAALKEVVRIPRKEVKKQQNTLFDLDEVDITIHD